MSATAMIRQYVDAQVVTGFQLYEEAELKVMVLFVWLQNSHTIINTADNILLR